MNRSKGQTTRRAEERKVAENRRAEQTEETKEAEHRRSNPLGFGFHAS